MNALRRLGVDLLHYIAPQLCPSCDEPLPDRSRAYCDVCRASLAPAPFPRKIYEELIGNFNRDELALSAIGSLYEFRRDSPVRALIHAVKYRGCFKLGVELGRDLGRAMTIFIEFEPADLITAVPIHPARRRERGYNQAEAIATGVADAIGRPIEPELLRRVRHTPSQTRLSARLRRENVADAFITAGRTVKGRSILLCDDVCTTGATLNVCAELLLAAGALWVGAVTVAHDTRQTPDATEPIRFIV